MLLQGNDDPSETQIKPAEGDDDEAPTCQQPMADELDLYEDDEVTTAPWVPPSSWHSRLSARTTVSF